MLSLLCQLKRVYYLIKLLQFYETLVCNGVIVRTTLVPQETFTGKKRKCALIDISVLQVPEAEVKYFAGK